jgi:hypothetical protein
MCIVTVVQHKKTRKLIPFNLIGEHNEVQIISSGVYNPDDYVVSRVDSMKVDWDLGYVVDEEEDIGKKEYGLSNKFDG